MTNKVITISRQFGSGGRSIGKAVAEKLGIPYYDTELVDKVAKESGFSHEFIELRCLPRQRHARRWQVRRDRLRYRADEMTGDKAIDTQKAPLYAKGSL